MKQAGWKIDSINQLPSSRKDCENQEGGFKTHSPRTWFLLDVRDVIRKDVGDDNEEHGNTI